MKIFPFKKNQQIINTSRILLTSFIAQCTHLQTVDRTLYCNKYVNADIIIFSNSFLAQHTALC